MLHTAQRIAACGWLCAAVLTTAGCEPKRMPPMTITDLMEDRVALDGVLMKCNQEPAKGRDDSDCLNARIAIERLAKDADPADEARRNAAFERRRELLRQAQNKEREERESRTRVDPYNLPIVPVDGTPPGNGATIASQLKP